MARPGGGSGGKKRVWPIEDWETVLAVFRGLVASGRFADREEGFAAKPEWEVHPNSRAPGVSKVQWCRRGYLDGCAVQLRFHVAGGKEAK